MKTFSILLLCDDDPAHANTVLDHISALKNTNQHKIYTFNPTGLKRSRCLDFDEFDVVVIHYSIAIAGDLYLAAWFKEKLRQYRGLKIQFIQDDYRKIDEITAIMQYLGINILFTLVPEDRISKIWDKRKLPQTVKISTLAGYIPNKLVGMIVPRLDTRPIDIGYRGRINPYWLGQLSQEKIWIGQGVLERAQKYQLRCDIAWKEEDRIYGDVWNRFITSCKALLGCESGASIADFDGSAERLAREYLTTHPDADFFEVQREILRPFEGNVPINVISPRMFEAVALRTALILFPGEYSGVLQPWDHYIPLNKDFSNMDEVVEKLRDTVFLTALAERAHTDIVASGKYSYSVLMKVFTKTVDRYAKPYAKRTRFRYRLSQAERRYKQSATNNALCYWWSEVLCPVQRGLLSKTQKVFVFLKVFVGVRLVRELLWGYVRNWKAWRVLPPKDIILDLMFLGIVKQVHSKCLPLNNRVLMIVPCFDLQNGKASFKTKIVTHSNANDPSWTGEPLWVAFESALRAGRISELIWDNSEAGERFVYPMIGAVYAPVWVDREGKRNFDKLVGLVLHLRLAR